MCTDPRAPPNDPCQGRSETSRVARIVGPSVMSTAWVLPPLPQRIGLMMLLAGPDAYLDDPDLDGYRSDLTGEWLEHQGL